MCCSQFLRKSTPVARPVRKAKGLVGRQPGCRKGRSRRAGRQPYTVWSIPMKKHLFFPVAALLALACSEPTSPNEVSDLTPSYGKSDPDPAPAAVCGGGNGCATWDDDIGTLAASSYGISSFDVASAPSGEKFSGRFSHETLTFVLPNAGETVDVRFKLYIVGAWA